MPSLNEVYIHHSPVASIEDGAFSGLTLEYLTLERLAMKEFPKGVFRGVGTHELNLTGLKRVTSRNFSEMAPGTASRGMRISFTRHYSFEPGDGIDRIDDEAFVGMPLAAMDMKLDPDCSSPIVTSSRQLKGNFKTVWMWGPIKRTFAHGVFGEIPGAVEVTLVDSGNNSLKSFVDGLEEQGRDCKTGKVSVACKLARP